MTLNRYPKSRNRIHLVIFILLPITLISCSTMQELTKTQKPRLSVKNARLSDLSFESLTIRLNVNIDNPNPIGLSMAGFDYDLAITGQAFLKGQQDRTMAIPSNGSSVLEVPITIQFVELYRAMSAVKNRDNAPYRIACGVTFDLPLFGKTRIPVSHSGTVPMIKLPSIRPEGLKVRELGLSGADLELRLKMSNPNAFGLSMRGLNYNLAIDGNRWAHGSREQATNISRGETGTIIIPIELDFAEMGMTVYRALSGKEPLDYRLTGGVDLGTTLPLLGNANLPIDLGGALDILP